MTIVLKNAHLDKMALAPIAQALRIPIAALNCFDYPVKAPVARGLNQVEMDTLLIGSLLKGFTHPSEYFGIN